MGLPAATLALALGLVVGIAGSADTQAAPLTECLSAVAAREPPSGSVSDVCAVIETASGPEGWSSPQVGSDVLAGLATKLAAADFLLLGEVHDNPSHHRARAQLILGIEAQRRNGSQAPGLVLEHIRADQGIALAAAQALERRQSRGAKAFLEALQWSKSGWPDASLFEPLFAAALDAEWPILPGNVATADIRNVARNGISSLPEEERGRLRLDSPLPAPLQDALLTELEASHCGLMPKAAFGGLAAAQQYRDAHLARAMADAVETYGKAVVLAGNGHVRRDRGVPWHLRAMAPGRGVAVVVFTEGNAAEREASTYVERGPDGAAIADYVVLTPRAERPDPCTQMRERFKSRTP